MRKIALTKGQFALVDNADYKFLNLWKWMAVLKKNNKWYAFRTAQSPVSKKKVTIQMPRVIMNAPKGMEVDHKDGNTLNNQRNNLRICTHAQNLTNRKKHKNNTSGYTGIRQSKKWEVAIKVKGKNIRLGTFTSKIEAAKAYDRGALKYFGEFARLNFPVTSPPPPKQPYGQRQAEEIIGRSITFFGRPAEHVRAEAEARIAPFLEPRSDPGTKIEPKMETKPKPKETISRVKKLP